MDLNDYWQENKRFVTTCLVGVIVFFGVRTFIQSRVGDDIANAGRRVREAQRNLANPMYGSQDLADARSENEALLEAVSRLAQATRFEPRDEFRLDASAGSASNQYLRALSRVREDLLPRANRANLRLDSGLGLPSLSPTREPEIERYLEALDAVESLCRIAIDSRLQRVEKIQIKLDPGLNSREGLKAVERTRIDFTLTGDSLSLARLLTRTQRPGPDGRVLAIEALELVPSRAKEDEIRLDLTLVLPRFTLDTPETEEA